MSRALVLFSSLPEVGGHTTTTLKLCEILAGFHDRVIVLAKEMPGHGTSGEAVRELTSRGVEVLPMMGRWPWREVRACGPVHTFLAVGMRHWSPLLALLLRPQSSAYYHITHELTPSMRRQLALYRPAFRRLVFLSPATRDAFGRGGSAVTWAVQPTGLPPGPPADRSIRAPGPLRLGLLGRLVPAKGTDWMLQWVTHSTENVELHVAGRGPSEDRVQAAALQLTGPGRVVWHGAFGAGSRGEFLRQFFGGVDWLVVPSLDDREGIPNVIMEAWQCGVPVVATTSGGIRSLGMRQLGPAPEAVVRLVPAEDLAAALAAVVAASRPGAGVARECRAYYSRYFSDEVLRLRWAGILA